MGCGAGSPSANASGCAELREVAPHPCLHCGALVPRGKRCRCRSTSARGYGSAWQKVSAEVLARDGWQCQLTLAGCLGRADTVDHLVPKARHGSDDPSNLVAACRPCNSRKGTG